MNRRALLAGLGCATLGTAGCLDWSGPAYCSSGYSFSMSRANAADVRRRESNTDADLNASPLVTDLVSRVLDGESVTLEVESAPDLFGGRASEETAYVERDGTFYELSREMLEEGTVTGPEYGVSRSGHLSDSVSDEEIAPFSALPPQDQWRLHDALSLSDEGGVIVFSDSFVAGYLDPDFREGSRLVSGIDWQYVEFGGRYVELEERGTATAPAVRFRYAADSVATDAESFADHVVGQRGVEFAELSAAARDLVSDLEENDEIELCLSVSGGESDDIDEANESERRAIDELRSNDEPEPDGIVYLRHDGIDYEVDWERETSAV